MLRGVGCTNWTALIKSLAPIEYYDLGGPCTVEVLHTQHECFFFFFGKMGFAPREVGPVKKTVPDSFKGARHGMGVTP